MHSTSGGVGVRDAKHAPTHAPPFSLIDVSCGRCDHGRRMHVARRATSLRACGWLLPSAGGLAAPSCYPKRSLLLAAMKSACFGPAWRVPRNGQSTTLLRRFQPVSRRPVANIGCRSFATARGRGGEVADLAAARPKGDSPDLLPDLALGRPKSEAPWSDVLSWVVFSDLHLSKRSLPVCLEILRLVHATARERGAGALGSSSHSALSDCRVPSLISVHITAPPCFPSPRRSNLSGRPVARARRTAGRAAECGAG